MMLRTWWGRVAALAVAAWPATVMAHRQWMLPSATVLSRADTWVTVDAAVSNELFYFDHVPLRLSGLVITAPDGSTIQPENVSVGRFRSTFDVHLRQPGTYRIASVNETVFATWMEDGEQKSWRGPATAFAKEVPAGAPGLRTARLVSRVETFVTAGKPDHKALEPCGSGLELVAITHPNDLIAGEEATLQLLLNGKPAANLEVTFVPGGIRYRDSLMDWRVTTDADGRFRVVFPHPGMYWMNATVGGPQRGSGAPESRPPRAASNADPPAAAGGGRMFFPGGDRASYTAVLEVMPE